MPRVRIATRSDRLPEEPALAASDRVAVTLCDGRTLAGEPVAYPRGHFKRGIEPAALWRKFRDCTAASLSEVQARRLFDQLQSLGSLAAIADLGAVPVPDSKVA
jgi:hypothetical protein